MGQFLRIGFVAEATTRLPDGVLTDDLSKEINGIYLPETYDLFEAEGKITLRLNSATVHEELVPFVRQVYEDYHGPSGKERLQESVDFITEIAEGHDWLEKAEKECLFDFYPIKHDVHDKFNVSGKMVCFYTNVIQLGSEGKFLMEEYCHTLSFLETCAHRAYSKFRLGKAFRVFVL
jgi:hypothetical protein